jgi:hypothetical protein
MQKYWHMCITITIIIVSVSNVFDYYNVKVQHYNNKFVQNSDNNNWNFWKYCISTRRLLRKYYYLIITLKQILPERLYVRCKFHVFGIILEFCSNLIYRHENVAYRPLNALFHNPRQF